MHITLMKFATFIKPPPPPPQKKNIFESIELSIFQQKIIMDPLTYNEVRTRPSLEERLESIISGAALMADSSCTRDDRRERIVQECNAVRQALQDLLTEYMNNVSCFHLSPNAETLKENYLVFTKGEHSTILILHLLRYFGTNI